MSELLEPVARSVPGERDEEGGLWADRDKPDPPGQSPELPVLGTADECEHDLEDDHEPDGGGGFPAGLDLLFAQGIASHTPIVVDGTDAKAARPPRSPGQAIAWPSCGRACFASISPRPRASPPRARTSVSTQRASKATPDSSRRRSRARSTGQAAR